MQGNTKSRSANHTHESYPRIIPRIIPTNHTPESNIPGWAPYFETYPCIYIYIHVCLCVVYCIFINTPYVLLGTPGFSYQLNTAMQNPGNAMSSWFKFSYIQSIDSTPCAFEATMGPGFAPAIELTKFKETQTYQSSTKQCFLGSWNVGKSFWALVAHDMDQAEKHKIPPTKLV